MIIKTGRFGEISIQEESTIQVPNGLFGFPDFKKFTLVDPGDDTLILWLQSLDNSELAFPVLEPLVFKNDYKVRLSAAEQRELKMDSIEGSAVFCILTIPEDVTQMTANIKAPLVINLKNQIGRQVVLQENEYSIRHEMFKELRSHLLTIQSNQDRGSDQVEQKKPKVEPLTVSELPVSMSVRSLDL